MDFNSSDKSSYANLSDFASALSDQLTGIPPQIITLLVSLPIITLGIVGNGLVIASWFVDRSIRSPSNALLISLAVPDILIWSFSAPVWISTILREGNWTHGHFFCVSQMVAAYLLPFLSSQHLVLIAVDRYRILTQGVSYLQGRSIRSVLEPVVWLWFVGFWLASPLLVDWEGNGIYEWERSNSRWICDSKKTAALIHPFVLGIAVLPELLLIRFYTEIYRLLKKRFNRNEFGRVKLVPSSGTESTDSSVNGNKNDGQLMKRFSSTDGSLSANQVHDQPTSEADRKERRAAITLGVLIVGFMVCWTPYVVVVIVQNIFRQEVHVMFFVISNLIGWLNSLINPVIYAVRNPEFRRAFRKVIKVFFVRIPSCVVLSVRDLCHQ
jgi:hypothetical protein